MSACTGYLESPLYVFLPFDIGKIEIERSIGPAELLAGVHHRGRGMRVAGEKIDYLGEAFHPIHLQIIDYGGFESVGLGQNDSFQFPGSRHDGHGEHPFYGEQGAVEAHFSHYQIVAEAVGPDLAVGGKYAQRDREVVGRSFLLHVARCQVDNHLFARKFVAGLLNG